MFRVRRSTCWEAGPNNVTQLPALCQHLIEATGDNAAVFYNVLAEQLRVAPQWIELQPEAL